MPSSPRLARFLLQSSVDPMKVALTVWEGRVSPVFDVCREALILDVGDGRADARTNQPLAGIDLRARTAQLVARGVDTLICGAISREAQQDLEAHGIRVIAFVAGGVDDVISAFANGQLSDAKFSMPGCGRRQRRRGSGRGRQCTSRAGHGPTK